MTIPDLLSVKDAAEKLSVSQQRVRTLLRSGHIDGRQIGRQWLIDKDSLSAYLEKGNQENLQDHEARRNGPLPKIKALSFFSGAMGLDLGLEKAGIHVLLACEIDKHCRKTIETNRPDLALLSDIWNYSADDIRNAAGLNASDEIDVIVGGPPCQAFSTAGARRGFNDHRGNVFLKYIDLILELKPKYAVIENVRGLLSAPLAHRPHSERDDNWQPELDERPGGALLYILERLREGGYGVSFNLYNSANFGVPQIRERVILLCSRDGTKLPYLSPTHSQDPSFGLPPWRTFKDAVAGNNKNDHVNFPEDRLRYYRLLGPGEYWKHLPDDLQREALGKSYFSGGGKTGFLRRLAWDKPSCTLVTSPIMPATDICHPAENRPISIQEYKLLQMFPNDWMICGSLTEQYRQVGNAVPVGLGEAVGKTILAHMNGESVSPPENFPFSRYIGCDEVSWEQKTRKGLGIGKGNSKPPATRIDNRKISAAPAPVQLSIVEEEEDAFA